MLIELAIGDAYGAGFEYTRPSFVQHHNSLTHYVQHPRHKLTPGAYTDDTQMSLAICEVLLSGDSWTPELLAHKFLEVFKRDPREGYASGFYHFLRKVQDADEFLECIRPTSDKSGAAMRAAPIGLYRDINDVLFKAELQAAITHDTPLGINAALAAALVTHYMFHRLGPAKDVGSFVNQFVAGDWSAPFQGKVGSKGWMSVRAAITALQSTNSMAGLLKRCISFSGDVGTVASVAMPAASLCPDFKQDLPTFLLNDLENGKFGRKYIQQLDEQLLKTFLPTV